MVRSVIFIITLIAFDVSAQEWCGVNADYFQQPNRKFEDFESWISEKRIDKTMQRNLLSTQEAEVYIVPVVFHVIHNGEQIGTGTNLSDERILDQLRILNEDFRRQNLDQNLTPDEFLDVAADTEIEFVLAKRDPNGLPSNGIVRKKGSKTTYEFQEVLLYSESFWPPEEFLNIYLADIKSPWIGWAAFPFSSLDGIRQSDVETNRLHDVVAIDYRYVGINPTTGGNFESFGRTLTHEMGHFFGLRHIWGDGGCSLDDFCEDTPLQSENYLFECPDEPQFSCGTSDIYSNYLNYTSDACMNVFTICQKERMRIVLENSPRRLSLRYSPALTAPEPAPNDLGISKIVSPLEGNCNNLVVPTVEVRNFGSNPITNFSISLLMDGILVETIKRTLTINQAETSIINYGTLLLSAGSITELTFRIDTVNSGIDGAVENNTQSVKVPPADNGPLPYTLDFESDYFSITKTESEFLSAWETDNVPYFDPDNVAAVMNFASHPGSYGLLDYLITPLIDLSSVSSAELSFAYAYSPTMNGYDKDGFIVAVSTDCGQTFPVENYLFEEYGSNLGTMPAGIGSQRPEGPIDWQVQTINITEFTGNSDLRFAFIGHHGNASTLFIDDIEILPTDLPALDLGILNTTSLPLVTCHSTVYPQVNVRNYGFEVINSFSLSYETEANEYTDYYVSQNLISGQLKNFGIMFEYLLPGTYDMTIYVSDPNDQADFYNTNDTIRHHLIMDNSERTLPIRQRFTSLENWISTNSTSSSIWNISEIEENGVMKANAYSNGLYGDQHWLVSPVLIADQMDSVSMLFRYAYGKRTGFSDRLTILLSVSCGQAYEYVLFDANTSQMEGVVSNSDYTPASDSEWSEVFLDLNAYKIWGRFRLAFVFTNGNGNNLYIDDIEFYNTGSPDFPRFEQKVTVYPNPADRFLKLSFDLPTKENVIVQLMDVSGKIIYQATYSDMLNQTIEIELAPTLSGMYLLRATGNSFTSSERIIIQK